MYHSRTQPQTFHEKRPSTPVGYARRNGSPNVEMGVYNIGCLHCCPILNDPSLPASLLAKLCDLRHECAPIALRNQVFMRAQRCSHVGR